MEAAKAYCCVLCSKRTKPNDRRRLQGAYNENIRKYLEKTFFITAKESDVLCNKCRQLYNTEERKRTTENKDDDNDSNDPTFLPPSTKRRKSEIGSPPSIALPIQSVGGGHSQCFVCKRRGPKLIVVSTNCRYNLFLEKMIVIPAGSRCCPGHIEDDTFTPDSYDKISDTRDNSNFNRTGILDLIKSIRDIALRNSQTRIDFDNPHGLQKHDYRNLTGITSEQFDDLCSHLKTIRDTKVRTIRTCLGIFLTKLKGGMSNKVLSTLFNISKDAVKRAVASARKALQEFFVNENIGFTHINRADVIQKHTRTLAHTLFSSITESPAILVLDGTYIYIQKSSQFQFQRKSYSMHKHRPLLKAMVVVSTTGYIISILGPYYSDCKNNDSAILKHMICNNIEEIKKWIQEDDIFVVDRGFRDSLEMLENIGIKAKMPHFITKGQKQHPTSEANATRLVTKVRWVVESVNGKIKQWRYFDRVLPNTQIPSIGSDLRFICALLNKYFPPLSSGDSQEDQAVASRMLYLAKGSNTLMEKIINEGLDKRSMKWKQVMAKDVQVVPNFPVLSEEELRTITLGVYQLKLANSYTDEHLNDSGEYEVLINDDQTDIIRVKFQSRHVGSKCYNVWIQFNEITVLAWYCNCRAGSRVVGTCSHIASVLWFLGFARHTDKLKTTTKQWNDFVADARNLQEVDVIDASDDNDIVTEE